MNTHETRAQTLYQLKAELFSFNLPEQTVNEIQQIEQRLNSAASDMRELSLSLKTIVELFDLAHTEAMPLEQLHALMNPYMENLVNKATEFTNILS